MRRIKPSTRANLTNPGPSRIRALKHRNTYQWPGDAKEYERKLGLAELRANGLVKKYTPSEYRTKIQQAIAYDEEAIYKALRSKFGRQSILKK